MTYGGVVNRRVGFLSRYSRLHGLATEQRHFTCMTYPVAAREFQELKQNCWKEPFR